MTIDINRLEMRSSSKFLLILFAVRFTTFWHRHRIMTHFWPPAVLITRSHKSECMRETQQQSCFTELSCDS